MISLENRMTQIDDILDRMAEQIQLDSTRYERMKGSYEAVKNWVESDIVFFKPYSYDVYPHGSVRILTTVKPIGRDEFDLDIAVHLQHNTPHTPQRIYSELKRRLSENEKYRGMMELKNRCIRLKYSGDFHMDIMVGIQENQYDENRLLVPDKKMGSLVSSNPRGYANWFKNKSDLVKESLLEKALRAENIPVDSFKYKKPLQRAVQLIKRYRDVFFQHDDSYRTSSIILTTISGQFYRGEASIFDTIDNIVTTIRNKVDLPQGRLKILNPVNSDEDFTDKWESEPKYYDAFKEFSKHLYREWQQLKMDHGVIEEGRVIKGLFGDEVFNKAQVEQSMLIEDLRKSKRLGALRNSGTISMASSIGAASIRTNTFFGN